MIMKKLTSVLLCTTLAATFAIVTAMPLEAAPAFAPQTPGASSDVQTIQYSPEWRRMHNRHMGDRHMGDARFHNRGGTGYYNGYRGYRNYRHGYREHNGWWFPGAA